MSENLACVLTIVVGVLPVAVALVLRDVPAAGARLDRFIALFCMAFTTISFPLNLARMSRFAALDQPQLEQRMQLQMQQVRQLMAQELAAQARVAAARQAREDH